MDLYLIFDPRQTHTGPVPLRRALGTLRDLQQRREPLRHRDNGISGSRAAEEGDKSFAKIVRSLSSSNAIDRRLLRDSLVGNRYRHDRRRANGVSEQVWISHRYTYKKKIIFV